MSELLAAENVNKSYKSPGGRLDVLRDINFSLSPGELCFVKGHSGAGKTTLLHILGGLDRPTSGEVKLGETRVFGLGERGLSEFRAKKVGFVFQFFHLLPELTLLENVLLPAMIARKSDRKLKERAAALLDRVGLKERAGHYPSQLSGGEQQRGAIARALVNEPEIVFCDEPTGNLDEKNTRLVFGLIKGMNRDTKQTFLVVTHEEDLVKDEKNVYRLFDGRLSRRD